MTSEMVREYLPLVRAIAHGVRKRCGDIRPGPDLDDLVSYGCGGLLQAAGAFKPERNVSFSTFAYYRIRGAMLDGVRRMAPLSRTEHERRRATPETTAPFVSLDSGIQIGSGTTPPDEATDLARAARIIREAVDELPHESRDLVRSYFYDERKLEDIGKATGRSKSWTCRLLMRALTQLKTRLLQKHPELATLM